jgi:hypothetical protein
MDYEQIKKSAYIDELNKIAFSIRGINNPTIRSYKSTTTNIFNPVSKKRSFHMTSKKGQPMTAQDFVTDTRYSVLQ